MVVAGYLLCSTNLRVVDKKSFYSSSLIGLPNGPPVRGRLTPPILRERADLVFRLIEGRIENLVIVNSALSEFEMIQACVEVADKYADNVIVIPPLLARMTYAVECLAIFRNPPENEVILVVTITAHFVDFVILRRDKNFELYIEKCENYLPPECNEMFGKFYDYYSPDSTIFVVQKQLDYVADQLKEDFNPANAFVKPFEKWDYVLLFGGMLRAINFDEGFDQRYIIANFSSGYEATIENSRSKTRQRHVLLPERTPLPCYIHGYDGSPKMIKMFYFTQYYQVSNDLVLRTRETTKIMLSATGSSKQVLGYVDERGIPYAPLPEDTEEFKKVEPSKVVTPVKQHPAEHTVASSVLFVDLATGSILECNPEIGTILEENVFDPNLPSSSTANPYQKLCDFLVTKTFSALNIITTYEVLNEGRDLFHSICNNVSYTPHIKAQLSYCFKMIKSEEIFEKFAIIMVSQKQSTDLSIFEYRSGQYFFILRVQDLTNKEIEMKIRSEYVKAVFIFLPKGIHSTLSFKGLNLETNVFEVRDFENMALNGISDMDENFKDLANTKPLRDLFTVPESQGRTTRSASDAGIFSQTSSPISDTVPVKPAPPPQPLIDFLFRDNYYAVEVFQNGYPEILTDSSGNEWTPLYLSMKNGKPEIGEKARDDCKKFPKHVIYDVLKVIGKPLNEIQRDPKWGFIVAEKNGNICFQVQTPNGAIQIPQEIVISAFLRSMKLCAESFMGNTELKEIRLSTSFKLSESQEAVFKAAAEKIKLKIFSFVVNASK